MQVKVGLFTKAWRDGRNTPFPPGLLTTGTLLPSVLVSCSYCNKLLQTRGVQQQKVPLSWWFWGIEIGSSLQALGVGRGICSLSHPASGDWWHFSTCGLITPAPRSQNLLSSLCQTSLYSHLLDLGPMWIIQNSLPISRSFITPAEKLFPIYTFTNPGIRIWMSLSGPPFCPLGHPQGLQGLGREPRDRESCVQQVF